MKRVLSYLACLLLWTACDKSTAGLDDVLAVVTEEAGEISGSTATLRGRVRSWNVDSGAELGFLVSTSPTLEHKTEIPLVYVDKEGRFYAQAKGLYPCTTYYYSAFVRGEVFLEGGIKSFTTAAFELSAVNIGLSVKWANANLGATSPELSGINILAVYYAAGIFCDAVAEQEIKQSLGERWRLPTRDEMKELVDTRDNPDYRWEWKEVGGRSGWEVTCLANGRGVFFPAAGWCDIIQPGIKGPPYTEMRGNGSVGYYPASGADGLNYAHLLFFTSSGVEFQERVCLGLGSDPEADEYTSRGFYLRPVLAE